jgi:hypothetical protein
MSVNMFTLIVNCEQFLVFIFYNMKLNRRIIVYSAAGRSHVY